MQPPSTPRIESIHFLVDGVDVYARTAATGERVPVVLVHGIGVSSRYMLPTMEALAATHDVYAPDLPGFGRSGRPDRFLDVAGLARALCRWIEAAGLDSPDLVANSFGCQVTLQLAASHPERVARAVLIGPTTDPRARSAMGQIARWLRNAPHEPPALGLVVARDYLDAGPRRILATFRAALADPLTERLARIDAPVLVVRGERDAIVPERWASELTESLPDARLVTIPDHAHTLNYSAPRELARAIRPFLAAPIPAPAARPR
jgi:pimeloyl-ACP methyl ester carboxylesterase